MGQHTVISQFCGNPLRNKTILKPSDLFLHALARDVVERDTGAILNQLGSFYSLLFTYF